MNRRSKALAVSCLVSTLGSILLAGTPALAATVHPDDPSCLLDAHGVATVVNGFQNRWTEYFTENTCGWPVRARVFCADEFSSGPAEIHYGKTIYGTGDSYYTCDVTQNGGDGNAEAYVDGQWIDYDN